jgi:hypothetical protein
MALQPFKGPGLPFWGFITITFLQVCIISPPPNPQPGGPGLRISPWHRVTQLYPQALGTHFSRLLRHAWVTEGPFFNPGHQTGAIFKSLSPNRYHLPASPYIFIAKRNANFKLNTYLLFFYSFIIWYNFTSFMFIFNSCLNFMERQVPLLCSETPLSWRPHHHTLSLWVTLILSSRC